MTFLTVRRLIMAAAVVLPLAGPTLLPALPHARLEHSNPADGAVLPSPRSLRLTFTEAPEVRISRVTLLRGDAVLRVLGKPAADAKSPETLVVPVTGTLSAGRYTVRYRVTGRDGHPISGAFAFTVR